MNLSFSFTQLPHGDQVTSKVPIVGSWRGHSPLQAGEFLFQKRMVRCACLLTFKPLQVPRNPRGLAFTRKAREDIRPKEVHELLLGALKAHPCLPLPSLLMAVLSACQLPQLLTSFGIGDNPQRALKRLPSPLG